MGKKHAISVLESVVVRLGGFAVSHVRVILLRGSSQFLADFQGQIQFHLKRDSIILRVLQMKRYFHIVFCVISIVK
jgi:hypothetical protein